MAVVIEVVSPVESVVSESQNSAAVIEVVVGDTTPTETVTSLAVTELVLPGGTVVNVGSGPVRPSNPYEGQIWIDVP